MAGVLRRIVPRAIRRSYALKFAIVLLVLGLAVGAIGVVATDEVQNEVESLVHDDHGNLAVQQAQSVRNWNLNNQDAVEAMARSSAIESGDTDEVQNYLVDEMTERHGDGRQYPQLHYINVETGSVEASTKTDVNLDPVSELEGEWFEELDDVDGTMMTAAYQSGDLGNDEPRIAYVTSEGDLEDGYVLAYTVPLGYYEQQMRGGESGVSMIVDESGTVLFSSPSKPTTDEVWVAYDEDDRPLQNAQDLSAGRGDGMEIDGAHGVLTERSGYGIGEGESYVVGYAPVPETNWIALVHTPSDDAYGFVQNVQQYGIYATGGIVLLVVLIGAGLGLNTSRAIDRLTSKAKRMEEGNLDVELKSARIDSIGQLYAGFDSMRNSLQAKITEAENARAEAEHARAETEAINRHLESKADEYRDVMQACGDGDLTARMEPSERHEAMRDIATEFNEMVGELEETTANVKAFANEVATASEQVTASSEEVRSASEQVTESIQEISDGAERQNQSLQSVNHEMSGLSTTTEQIAASSNQVADIAERTERSGKRGREAAQNAIEGMDAIEAESEAAVADIERLESEMEQIDELIEFISEVAKETNMLALNANIEASRSNAGDDGFSVVAAEVKELAEETKDAAEDIEALLEAIQQRTAETAESVTGTSERVEANRAAVQDAVDALDDIAEYAEETNTGVQEISAATEEQAASTQEVVAMADDAATISEETTAEAENVAAAAEEQTTALTEVSQSASDLATQAAQLSEALDRFDTDVETELRYDEDSLPAVDSFEQSESEAAHSTPPKPAESEGNASSDQDDSDEQSDASSDQDDSDEQSDASSDQEDFAAEGTDEADAENHAAEESAEDVFSFGDEH